MACCFFKITDVQFSSVLYSKKFGKAFVLLPSSSCMDLLNIWASQVALVVKNLSVNAGDLRDTGSIPGLGWSPREGHGNPLHYSCWRIPWTDIAWQPTVHRVTKSWTWLKWLSMHALNIYHVVGLITVVHLLLWSTCSGRMGSVVVVYRLSCSAAFGIFPDQGSNQCPLHWQADS